MLWALAAVPALAGGSSASAITRANVAFISYPNFPEASSTWFDIGYSSKYDKVFVAVTNHRNKQMLYAYDVESGEMHAKGIITDLAHLRPFQHQGKVHTKIVEGPKGNMFFGTDGGASREEYFMNHPLGYLGGFFMKWNPAEDRLTNLGIGMRFDSIKDVDVDRQTGRLYGISYPQVHFLLYDVDKNRLRDLGRLGSAHVPRVMFTDRWGNAYYVDWRQRLVKYDKSEGRLIFSQHSLPAFPGTPGGVIITGIMSFAKAPRLGVIFIGTYGGKLIAFHPRKEGMGTFEDLGGFVNKSTLDPGIPPWEAYTPSMAFGDNGKLYYFVGFEGRYAQKNTCLLVEYDPQTSHKRVLLKFPLSVVSGATGSNVKDSDGNLYFAGMRLIEQDGHRGHVPFMIKFNPTHEVRK